MKTYVVGYDLDKPGQDYKTLIDRLKSYSWWHCLDSTWLIKSNDSAEKIRNDLLPLIDTNDKLLVAALTGESAWHGFNEKCAEWLRNNIQPS